LTALIVGGAGVAASQLGLFGKLAKVFALLFVKLGKLIIGAFVGAVAWVRSLFRKKRPATA
jgi:hypothetical protein